MDKLTSHNKLDQNNTSHDQQLLHLHTLLEKRQRQLARNELMRNEDFLEGIQAEAEDLVDPVLFELGFDIPSDSHAFKKGERIKQDQDKAKPHSELPPSEYYMIDPFGMNSSYVEIDGKYLPPAEIDGQAILNELITKDGGRHCDIGIDPAYSRERLIELYINFLIDYEVNEEVEDVRGDIDARYNTAEYFGLDPRSPDIQEKMRNALKEEQAQERARRGYDNGTDELALRRKQKRQEDSPWPYED